MSDLLSQENVDQFRAAMRSVTDTFHKTPVTLLRPSGGEFPLLAGLKPDDVGSYGEVHGEMYAQEERAETVERWIVSFNRDYLAEQGLSDLATDQVTITPEDRLLINGKRFSVVKLSDKGLFRGVPIMFLMTVVR
jgi:hypothetical protein